MYIYIYIYITAHLPLAPPLSPEPEQFGRPILYTTTTQRVWCIEAFVSILAHLQSLKLLPGGGGV